MDGVHDLGGMHGFGLVEREENEPAFHDRWEASVRAMQEAARSQELINIDEFRHGIERMNPSNYLTSSYYEHWLDGITRLLLEKGVVGESELSGRERFFLDHEDALPTDAIAGPLPPAPPPPPQGGRQSVIRETIQRPRFKSGDRIVTRNFHPAHHTRLARYARGKPGVVHRFHGTHVFPDTSAHGLGENPQPLYSVRFTGQDLWGEDAEPNQVVYLDLWESYLEPSQD